MIEPVPPALKRFIWDIQSMVELADSDREILMIGQDLLARYLACGEGLPQAFSSAGDALFRQYQLYADAMERFCVVATVLAPGAALPACRGSVWELFGLKSGSLRRQRLIQAEGAAPAPRGPAKELAAGAVESFSPKARDGSGTDLIALANSSGSAPAIAVHVYGGEVGGLPREAVGADGQATTFTTLYANPPEAPAYDILTIQTQIVD